MVEEKTLESVTEVECSVRTIDRNTAIVDFWDGDAIAFNAEVARSELPEYIDFEDARLRCTLKIYIDGSTELKFDYPHVDLENLRGIIEKNLRRDYYRPGE